MLILFFNIDHILAKKIKTSKLSTNDDDGGMSALDKAKLAGDCIKGLMASIPESFCWKKDGDVGIVPTGCPEGYFRSLALCYRNCDPGYGFWGGVCWENCSEGYDNHGATCYKNLIRWYFKKSYIPNSITNFSDQVLCPPAFYRPAGSALCYRDCNNISMENCGIGACSSDSATCVTTIIDMGISAIQGAVDAIGFVASFGATTALAPAKKAITEGIKKIGKQGMKQIMKGTFKSLRKNQQKIFTNAIKKVKENLIKSGKKIKNISSAQVIDKFTSTKMKENVLDPAKETIKSNVLGTICTTVFDQFMKKSEEAEKNDFPIDLETAASTIDVVNIQGSIKACSDLSDDGLNCAKNVISGLSTFDPTGLLGIASSFMQPVCDVPATLPPIDPEVEKAMLLNEKLKNKKCILVFDECDFKGNSKEICSDVSNLAEFDNKISSIIVGTESHFIGFEEKYFGGMSLFIGPGEIMRCLSDPSAFVGGKSLDNAISSIKFNEKCIIFASGKQSTPGVKPNQILNNLICKDIPDYSKERVKFNIPDNHNWLYVYTYRTGNFYLEFYEKHSYFGESKGLISHENINKITMNDIIKRPLSVKFFLSIWETKLHKNQSREKKKI